MKPTSLLITASALLSLALKAQPPTIAYRFKPLVSSGATIGGHTLTPDTAIDGVALSDAGEVVFVAHSNHGRREHTAVFTSTRFVAEDGNIDGRYVTKILPNCIAINSLGQVAFEGVYVDGPTSHTGIFIDGKFITTLTTAGSPNDFTISDDGTITLKGAVAPVKPPAKTRTWLPPGIGARLPQIINKTINQNPNIPIGIDPSIPAQRIPPPAPRPQTQVAKAPVAPARACAVPEWPYPSAWNVGDEMIGPVVSHIFENPVKNRFYEPLVFDRMLTPFRIIECSSDGKPLIVIIGDKDQPGHFEMYTPNGLLTYTKEDGFLDLNGFSGNVLPGLVVRADTPLRVNRRGQVAMPVTFEDRYAILLATPTGGPR